MNKMGKADVMIMLMTLYNRINDNGTSKAFVDNEFNIKVKKLEKEGHITAEDAKFALAYLIPSARAQEVDKIKAIGAKEERAKIESEMSVKAGYSKSAEISKINSILDSAFDNEGKKVDGKAWEPPKPKLIEDPCGPRYFSSSC